MKRLVIGTAALLGACATASEIPPPPKRCMVGPSSVENYVAGDDLMRVHGTLLNTLKRESSKVRCLQKWARLVSKKA